MSSITLNLRKIPISKRTSISTTILSASMKSSCPVSASPRQQRRTATIATKPVVHRRQLTLVPRLYHRHRWAPLCIIIRVIVLRITTRKRRCALLFIWNKIFKFSFILVSRKNLCVHGDRYTKLIHGRFVLIILAGEANSSQAATKYASEHSNHGKHCHHKDEHVVEQHSKQNHSHDA